MTMESSPSSDSSLVNSESNRSSDSDSSVSVETTASGWRVDWLLIAAVLAVLAGRIFALQPHAETRFSPFMSANDRSRWATIRALGDDGTYAIEHLTSQPRSIWNTIDKVVHKGQDGQLHEYSSKPTLFPTMLAYLYRAIRFVTGWSLDGEPFAVTRLMLLLVNVLPLGLLLACVNALARSRSVSLWTRGVLILGLGLGTFLGTFVVTLNNHLPAAISVAVGVMCIWQVAQVSAPRAASSWWWAIGGLAGAFAAANELPALSFFCLLGAAFLWLDWKRTLLVFLPAAGLIACGSFATTWQAHGSFRPAYAHRSDGEVVKTLDADLAANFARGELPETTRKELNDAGVAISSLWKLEATEPGEVGSFKRWVLTDLNSFDRWAIVLPEENAELEVRAWDNWYEYPGSYWSQPREARSSVDQGEESHAAYALHMLVGHHGLLSLTPIFALALVGWSMAWRKDQTTNWKALAFCVALLTAVCFLFYLTRPLIDRNYGGQTSYLRWMLWFAPLWMLMALDAIEWLNRTRWGRVVVLALLSASIASAAYSQSNPWVHPWIYAWFVAE